MFPIALSPNHQVLPILVTPKSCQFWSTNLETHPKSHSHLRQWSEQVRTALANLSITVIMIREFTMTCTAACPMPHPTSHRAVPQRMFLS